MDIFLMAASLRKDSVNKKLTDLCQKILSADHQIDYANMTEFDVPLYKIWIYKIVLVFPRQLMILLKE
jgi:NAD(P)H-dependent FMN reductase